MLRKGMWVKVGGKLGIINDMDPEINAVEVHFVDPDSGDTIGGEGVYKPYADIQQAALADIPEPRKAGWDEADEGFLERLAIKGYR